MSRLYQLHRCHHYQLRTMTEMVTILELVINQGCFSCLSAACSSLLSPIKGCLYLNNKALISVNYYSAGYCILSTSLCLALPLSSSSTCSSSYKLPPHIPPFIHSLSFLPALTSPCPSFPPMKESRDIGILTITVAILFSYLLHFVHTTLNCVTSCAPAEC